MSFGIMLHHFHHGTSSAVQGSITPQTFGSILDYLKTENNILNAEEYFSRSQSDNLQPNDICITFDDALKSQYTHAKSVLDEFGIKAYFFVYSGAFADTPPYMEFFRDFRNSFSTVNEYYAEFMSFLEENLPEDYSEMLNTYREDYLSEFSFYTQEDRKYRFVRDNILKDRYFDIVVNLMEKAGYDMKARQKELFMSENQISQLSDEGHMIGLHSTTHPTTIQNMSYSEQREEYFNNMDHLSSIVSDPIISMSHPCGNYNDDTLMLMKELDIHLGFRSSMTPNFAKSDLEVPREDHTNIVNAMNNLAN